MEAVIGKKYKTNKHNSINVEYRDRGFVVIEIDNTHIHIMFDGIDRHRTITKDRWKDFVVNDFQPWEGNIIKFHFV